MITAALLTLSIAQVPAVRPVYPRVWTSESGEYAVSMIPGKNPATKLARTELELFTFAADGRHISMWKSSVNYYPNQILISPDARVVILNEYPGFSDQRAVVILSDEGRILAQYGLSALMPKAEANPLLVEEGGPKRWAEFAVFSSVRSLKTPPKVAEQKLDRQIGALELHNEWPYVLQIKTVTGRMLWFDLLNGKLVS